MTISVGPDDGDGLGSGPTPFTRTYESGAQVTLTAPALVGSNTFRAWSGCTSTSGTTCRVGMDRARTVRVNYRDPSITPTVRNDFDGDGRSDIGCYFPDGGNWYGFGSTDGFWQTQFGYRGDAPGHRRFRRRREGRHRLLPPAERELVHLQEHRRHSGKTQFGYAGTIPVVGDFDGDGRDDIGCYHPPSGNWYVLKSTEGFWQTQFGYAGTIPIVGDFDGDGRGRPRLLLPGRWQLVPSSRAPRAFWQTTFGYAGTIPVVGDFDGDGRDDIGCYYPPGGNWYVFKSTEGFWQTSSATPAPNRWSAISTATAKSDLGCYYPAGGNWYVFRSTEGFRETQFGYGGTIPLGGTLR